MREKIKNFVKNIFGIKDVPGDPLDYTPGIKVTKTVGSTQRASFNETFQHILDQKNLLK